VRLRHPEVRNRKKMSKAAPLKLALHDMTQAQELEGASSRLHSTET
jgi:hypothetical protein